VTRSAARAAAFGLLLVASCSKGPRGAAGASAATPLTSAGSPGQAPAGTGPSLSSGSGLSKGAGGAGTLAGRWAIIECDGVAVDPNGEPGTDPKDQASFMSGSFVEFGDGSFRLSRGQATTLERPLTVIRDSDPNDTLISIGYGPSPVRFVGDKVAKLHLETVPPHDFVLRRD
jgi:hypothetical protein